MKSECSTPEEIVEPLVQYAERNLEFRLKRRRLPASCKVVESFRAQLKRKLVHAGADIISLRLRSTAAAAYSLALTQPQFRSAPPPQPFVCDYGSEMISLFETFPALARLWSELINDWIDKVIQIMTRLERDRGLIAKRLMGGIVLGPVREIKCDISDPHNRGRETLILSFDYGSIVYKPRCGRHEKAWFSLLEMLNRQGFEPRFRKVLLLCRRNYCWMEFVMATPCKTEREASFYYRRAGALTCLAYLLGTIDCHRDNLIAAGDQPVLIDAETLLHRETVGASAKAVVGLARSGLLPIGPGNVNGAYEVSAFGGDQPGDHVPTLEGAVAPLSQYTSEVALGFREMWQLVGERGAPARRLFRQRLRAMQKIRWRRVCYPTSKYLEICKASLQPYALECAGSRRLAIQGRLARRGAPQSLIDREVKAVMRLDVPYFTEIPRLPTLTSISLPDLLDWIKAWYPHGPGVPQPHLGA